jgi:hypothetical protein
MLLGIIHSFCIEKRILKTKRNLKIDSESRSNLENPINFDPLWFLHPILKFGVPTLFRKLVEFSDFDIKSFLDLASILLKF